MKLTKKFFCFVLLTLLCCCVFSTFAQANRKRTTTKCSPGSWIERVVRLGKPLPTVVLLGGDIEVQITDNEGNVDSIGGNYKITNHTADEIEYQPGNVSNYWLPLAAGESVMDGLTSYRSTKDKSPTVYSLRVRYKCGTQSSGKNQQNNQDQQSQQNQTQTHLNGCN